MLSIQFLGAAQTVTGSKYLIRYGQRRFMVDCGLFQGSKKLRQRNWESLPFDESGVETVVLTHAHIDHSGYLPKVVRDGFEGKIHCTMGTKDLTAILLADSARLQEEQANYMNRKRLSKHKPALPLYTVVDAEQAIRRLTGHKYNQEFPVVEGVTGCFVEAGHILGSAWLRLDFSNGKRLIFSGDLGRYDAPILRDPESPERTDYLILESTYGDRLHAETDPSEGLHEAVCETIARNGVLVIPAFAVERTQEVVYMLEDLIRGKDIPKIPVFIDSPMAVRATRLFKEYTQYWDEEASRLLEMGQHVFQYENLRLCESVEESKSIQRQQPPFIVISASGMATGGRILHHLKHYLPDPRNKVLLVGYQSVGTRGWRLQQGEEEIKIHGDWIPVRAEVSKLEGFSGHADYGEIDRWLRGFSTPPQRTFLTHGDPEALLAQELRLKERGWEVHAPEHLEEVQLV